MDIFRYLFCMMFADRSVYMQMKTGTYGEAFSKNTIYRFLNNARTNWQRFTTLLSAAIICGFMKPLTNEERKDGFWRKASRERNLPPQQEAQVSKSLCMSMTTSSGELFGETGREITIVRQVK